MLTTSKDTSDEAIAKRHSSKELEERKRYIQPLQKKKKKDAEEKKEVVGYFCPDDPDELLPSYPAFATKLFL